jgi:hypothetical protein
LAPGAPASRGVGCCDDATAERTLGDVSAESGIDRIYSRWKYFPQMKAALEAYKQKLAGRRLSMVVGATCGRKDIKLLHRIVIIAAASTGATLRRCRGGVLRSRPSGSR